MLVFIQKIKKAMKESDMPLIKDYMSFRYTYTGVSVLKFFFFQLFPFFPKRRYYPFDKKSTLMGSNIYVGKNSVIAQRGGCYIQGNGKLFIGNYVRVTQNCIIVSSNHDIKDHSKQIPKETVIGDYCWIASNSCIMAGCILGPRTIVGAGSVVTKSFIEGYCVIAGNPAKIVKTFSKDEFIPPKVKVDFYGYIRADKFPKYFEKHFSDLKFDYDVRTVSDCSFFYNMNLN